MHINYRSDENYNNKGLIISVTVHGLLLLGLFFIVAWYPPNPPLPGAPGIAINFGVDDYGMGENNEQPSVQNEVQPVQEEPQEEVSEPVATDQSEVVTTKEETPYALEEKKEKKVPQEVKKITESPKENTKEVKASEATTNVTKSDSRNSMGNGDKNKAGDQGKTNGTLDSKNFYGNGNSGNGGDGPGGNGSSLNMSGWRWTSAPKVKDNSSESGKIVFKVTVDEDGSIISVVTTERQVSAAVAKQYEDAVWKLELEKTKDFVKAAQNSTGYITFIIRSK
ncbi:MAG: outer rane transport energization protein TonB [Chitinophagaceae bacterium]|nr:outer rane transport energization protein TonB [Chitinophagaceae bacterium]